MDRPGPRVAVIGASHWHTTLYLDALRPVAQVVAISDDNAGIAQEFAAAHRAAADSDVRDLLARTRPDLAFVLGRHGRMADAARTVGSLGIPLVLEKPGAIDLTELTDLAAHLRGAPVAVPLVHRASPFLAELRATGNLTHLTISYVVGPPERYVAAQCPWMLDPAAGGGVLVNLGPHFTDLVTVLGGVVTDVVARTSHTRHGLDIEDHAVLLLATRRGLTATIDLGYLFPPAPTQRHVSVSATGSGGAVHIGPDGRVTRTAADGVVTSDIVDVDSDTLFAPFVHRALATFRDGFRGLPGLPDLVAAMRVVDTAYRSTGRRGWPAWAA